MNVNDNPYAGLEAWAMLLLHARWDREADLIFAAIEKRDAEAAPARAQWTTAFAG